MIYLNLSNLFAPSITALSRISLLTPCSAALEAKDNLLKSGIDCSVINLSNLSPLDTESIISSVNKTGKAIILHEDSLFGGLGSEISSIIMENCFENLDAPVIRVGSLNTPIPFEESLEKQYLPFDRFEKEIKVLLNY